MIEEKDDIELCRPVQCDFCEKFLSKFNISCLYLSKGEICPGAQAILDHYVSVIMKYMLDELNDKEK